VLITLLSAGTKSLVGQGFQSFNQMEEAESGTLLYFFQVISYTNLSVPARGYHPLPPGILSLQVNLS